MLTHMEIRLDQSFCLRILLTERVTNVSLLEVAHFNQMVSTPVLGKLATSAILRPASDQADASLENNQKDQKDDAVATQGYQISAHVGHFETFKRDIRPWWHVSDCVLHRLQTSSSNTRRSIEKFFSGVLPGFIQELLGA
mmetsp:Transcript_46513/g.61630  ORF Transcript_46513/g.61630 Transcript_46513/m.61630 type:complete len:140 (-) Transcript_46513:2100-2519(-)